MRPNKVETAVHMSYAFLVGFSGHGNSIYNIILLFRNKNVCQRKTILVAQFTKVVTNWLHVCIYPALPLWARCDTRSIFRESTAELGVFHTLD